MSESCIHISLVHTIAQYTKLILDKNDACFVMYDSPYSKRPTKAIEGFIPDVYFWHGRRLIVGEAKTTWDFDNKHSISQFAAYIQECENFFGESTLIVGVPWEMVPHARNFLRRMRKELDAKKTEIIVLNETGAGGKI